MKVRDRVKKAIDILDYSIKNNISITKACRVFSVSDTYVKNVKGDLAEDVELNDRSHEEYNLILRKYEQLAKVRNPEKNTSESEKRTDVLEKEKINKTINEDASEMNINYEAPAKDFNDYFLQDPEHIKTLEQLLEKCNVDSTEWKVKHYIVNKWDVSAVIDGLFVTKENFQVKATLERNKTEYEKKQWSEFLKTVKSYAPDYSGLDKFKKTGKEKYLLEMSLFDLHVGKLSWDEESGENYDTKIAIERFNNAVKSLLNHVINYKDQINEILLPVGNDLINIDNKFNKTTAGTDQHVDSRWQQMFRKTKELMIRNIDILSQIAPVKVLMVSGNHDQQTVFYLGEVLDAWYLNNKRVTIDNNASQRKYHRYGTNLIGFTHGNEEKHLDLPYLMSEERREDWAETKYREIHLGHFHKRKSISFVDVDENRGVKIRVLPSLSGADAWHSSKGYRSMKSAVAFLYEKEMGMVAEFSHNVL